MFGGILSKLLARGAGNEASTIAGRFGSEIGANLARNYGDDVAMGAIKSMQPKAMAGAGSKLSQLLNGVDDHIAINPNIAENFSVMGATNKALPSTVGFGSKLNKVSKSIEGAGTKLKNSQLTGTLRDLKLLDRAPEAIKWADDFGIPNNQYGDIAELMTGGKGILSNFNDNALKYSQKSVIVPDEARMKALDAVKNTIDLKPSQKKTISAIINDAHNKPLDSIGERVAQRGEQRASAFGEADIYDLHKTVQELESAAYGATGASATSSRKILRNYANDLKKVINEHSKDIYSNADNIQELKAALEGANLPPKLSLDIIDKVRGGMDYLGARKMQSPAVILGKIAEAEKTAPLTGGVGFNRGLMGGPLGQVTQEVVGKPLAMGVGKTLQIVGRAGQLASKANPSNALKYGAMGVGGLGALNLLGAGGGGNDPASAGMTGGMNNVQDPNAGGMGVSGVAGMGSGNNPANASAMAGAGVAVNGQGDEPTFGGYTRTDLENAYVAALNDNNLKAANAISTMLDGIGGKEARSDKNTKSTDTSKTKAKAENAKASLARLMKIFNEGGGAQGPMGAIGKTLNKATFGNFNPKQAAFEDMLQATAVAVARANGEVGVLSDKDIQNYLKMLPTFSDSKKQAQIKLETIMSGLDGME